MAVGQILHWQILAYHTPCTILLSCTRIQFFCHGPELSPPEELANPVFPNAFRLAGMDGKTWVFAHKQHSLRIFDCTEMACTSTRQVFCTPVQTSIYIVNVFLTLGYKLVTILAAGCTYALLYAHFVYLYCPISLVHACVSQVFSSTCMHE